MLVAPGNVKIYQDIFFLNISTAGYMWKMRYLYISFCIQVNMHNFYDFNMYHQNMYLLKQIWITEKKTTSPYNMSKIPW